MIECFFLALQPLSFIKGTTNATWGREKLSLSFATLRCMSKTPDDDCPFGEMSKEIKRKHFFVCCRETGRNFN
jgi:hypothetical protein